MAFGSSELLVRVRDRGDGCAVQLVGELDLHNVTSVQSQFELILGREPLPASILVDIGELRFMDSLGIAALVRAQQDARSLGCGFRVVSMSPAIARLLELTGLAGTLTSTSE